MCPGYDYYIKRCWWLVWSKIVAVTWIGRDEARRKNELEFVWTCRPSMLLFHLCHGSEQCARTRGQRAPSVFEPRVATAAPAQTRCNSTVTRRMWHAAHSTKRFADVRIGDRRQRSAPGRTPETPPLAPAPAHKTRPTTIRRPLGHSFSYIDSADHYSIKVRLRCTHHKSNYNNYNHHQTTRNQVRATNRPPSF